MRMSILPLKSGGGVTSTCPRACTETLQVPSAFRVALATCAPGGKPDRVSASVSFESVSRICPERLSEMG